MTDLEKWFELRRATPERVAAARGILEDVRSGLPVIEATRRHPLPGGGYLPKSVLVAAYNGLVESGEWSADPKILATIRMKPVRTLSGVTTVTVLTKPYPCPGKCIFCPTDARMPKSYLPDEPGAMRGLQNNFDPYLQVSTRIEALEAVGHPTDKIELLILGGTWSSYRRDYQEDFIHRCFQALNGVSSAALPEAQRINESAEHRNVGLVIETRPDEVTPKEIAWLRYLGVTKVQMGAQSLDDRVLELNKRGHTAAETKRAVAQLRAAGFKIVLHWMPNLLGATVDSDRADFAKLFTDGYCPDEIKIYPCQLLANAELHEYWQRGEYIPYTQDELVNLIADIKPGIPVYCRVNRVIRDIPSTNVVAGNKRTSLRMDVFAELERRGQQCRCIRCREVRGETVRVEDLRLVDTVYSAASGDKQGETAEEHFLQFVTPSDKIAGYLRLSLPPANCLPGVLPDLLGDTEMDRSVSASPRLPLTASSFPPAALIREVHVYGQSLAVGEEQAGAAQHAGLGTRLLEEAARIAKNSGYTKLAVIAAIGTRLYYEGRGFQRGETYMVRDLA